MACAFRDIKVLRHKRYADCFRSWEDLARSSFLRELAMSDHYSTKSGKSTANKRQLLRFLPDEAGGDLTSMRFLFASLLRIKIGAL